VCSRAPRRGKSLETTALYSELMPDKYSLTLRQIDGARGDLYAIQDELETVKLQLARIPTRAYFCKTLLMATASIWALMGAFALLLAR
jgi:hypothetical protein